MSSEYLRRADEPVEWVGELDTCNPALSFWFSLLWFVVAFAGVVLLADIAWDSAHRYIHAARAALAIRGS